MKYNYTHINVHSHLHLYLHLWEEGSVKPKVPRTHESPRSPAHIPSLGLSCLIITVQITVAPHHSPPPCHLGTPPERPLTDPTKSRSTRPGASVYTPCNTHIPSCCIRDLSLLSTSSVHRLPPVHSSPAANTMPGTASRTS